MTCVNSESDQSGFKCNLAVKTAAMFKNMQYASDSVPYKWIEWGSKMFTFSVTSEVHTVRNEEKKKKKDSAHFLRTVQM